MRASPKIDKLNAEKLKLSNNSKEIKIQMEEFTYTTKKRILLIEEQIHKLEKGF